MYRLTLFVALAVLALGAPAVADEPAPGAAAAAMDAQPPLPLPPADSGPLLRFMELRFHPENVSLIEPQTYLYYIQTQPSRSLDGVWVPFNDATEASLLADFKRLWATSFLDNLWIEVEDAPYDNGVMGKRVIFNMEERSRIKIVDYTGSTKVERTKIDEKMRELGIALRLDSFLDEGAVRRVRGLVQNMMAEKGYQDAEITTSIEPLPGGPKLVKVVFHVEEGPKVRIRTVDFTGNEAMSDGALRRRMKDTKAHWFLSWMTGRGTFQEAKFDEDADRLVEHYRNRGYIETTIGQPQIERLSDSPDGKTRWVRLVVPVSEGPRYRVGEFAFAGNTIVEDQFLRPLFKLKTGDWYSEKRIRDGLEKARELYGQGGYFEFTGYPDLAPEAAAAGPMAGPAQPTVNVTMQMQEGGQYFVNRITFTGNTTTRDTVVRRELRLVEGGVFNTEALKYSIRRLNQLGYFQQLEGGQDIQVDKTPDVANNVDVTMKLQEQNRNQLTFGAGVSQFEGFFGQLSFQTANFLGRGESLTVSLQGGSRAQNYQVAFTEPFLFDRNITGGVDVFKRELRYIGQFTQSSMGGNLLMGFPVRDFSRMFVTYSHEQVSVKDLNPAYQSPELLQRNPFLRDSLLIGAGGKRTISKIVPSFVFNTVDNPIFPNTGRRLQMSVDYAGPGGNTYFVKPSVEAVGYFRMTPRTTFGTRFQFQYIRPYGSTERLPIFEQLFLGGEYSIRGFDLRSVGPRDPESGLVLGGNKSLLFNAEYLISIAGPVRLVLFFDAGQVRDLGEKFGMKEDIIEFVSPSAPILFDPFAFTQLTNPNAPPPERVVRGQRQAFKTSTGAEIRFFMPVLNVPFRLIFAMNPSRDGVLDNNFQPSKNFVFRFAVGSTF
ncbi:MAG: outer membrane protein assembly factor BamA [Vicinamibacterales bacterium]|nr:outer membrane protein assembly factor BamA [Vicinamibacterales bacterium]